MKYKHPLFNQQQLGRLFGSSSHEVGKWLVEVGMRDGTSGKPTREAYRGGYCDLGATGPVGWRPERVVPLLQNSGHRLLVTLPDELVEPSDLSGPFSIHAAQPREVVNADGTTALVASSSKNAVIIIKLLNLAHEAGVIHRWQAGGDKSAGPEKKRE